MEASKSFRTLPSMVDQDMQTNTVRKQGSHSRNLLMIKRGLDFLRVLFEQILLTEYVHTLHYFTICLVLVSVCRAFLFLFYFIGYKILKACSVAVMLECII